MNTFEKAQVGDKVYSLRYGEGKIIGTPGIIIEVKFGNRILEYYCCGKLRNDDNTADLYWGKPEIIAPEAPKRLVDKTITRYCNVYVNALDENYLGQLHKTKEHASKALYSNYGGKHNLIFEGAEVIVKYKAEE